MKILYQQNRAPRVPLFTGGLAMGRGYLGAFVLRECNMDEQELQKSVAELIRKVEYTRARLKMLYGITETMFDGRADFEGFFDASNGILKVDIEVLEAVIEGLNALTTEGRAT
jgi:hypothetical protein